MDHTGKPSDLFVKFSALSPRVAEAFAVHLATRGAARSKLPGRAALRAAVASLPDGAREALEPTFSRLNDLCGRRARACVLEHARELRRDSCPWVVRVLEAVSTPDLAVRMYLDDEAACERAHLQFATSLLAQMAIYQGQYTADVIPSLDRRARMLRALYNTQVRSQAAGAVQAAELVSDGSFALMLHRGAELRAKRQFDFAQQLDPNLCQAEIEVAVLFRFDASTLIVKAPSLLEREALRDAFSQIFVGDPRYFDKTPAPRPRYRLTIDPAPSTPLAKPSVARAISRVKAAPLAKVGERSGPLTAPVAQIHQEQLLRISPPFAPRLW